MDKTNDDDSPDDETDNDVDDDDSDDSDDDDDDDSDAESGKSSPEDGSGDAGAKAQEIRRSSDIPEHLNVDSNRMDLDEHLEKFRLARIEKKTE